MKKEKCYIPVWEREIETVLGLKLESSLGTILPHEHLQIDCTRMYKEPTLNNRNRNGFSTYDLENFGAISYEPYSCKDNLKLNADVTQAILDDLLLFKESGGGTIVDNTTISMRPPDYGKTLQLLSQKSGINIIIGAGFNCSDLETQSTKSMTKESMYNQMKHEVEIGCNVDDQYIKAAFIGEIACSFPIKDTEKQALAAAGQLQEDKTLAVSLNPGKNSPEEILRIYTEAGGDEKHAVICHLDSKTEEDIIDFFDFTKCYCQFTRFGTEISYNQLDMNIDVLSDAQRIDYLWHFKKHKQLHRVLFSHGIHTRHKLVKFGGHGFTHIGTSVVPFMKFKGFSKSDIETVTVTNPFNWITCS